MSFEKSWSEDSKMKMLNRTKWRAFEQKSSQRDFQTITLPLLRYVLFMLG